MPGKKLLDRLSQLSQCVYLSELRDEELREAVNQSIQIVEEDSYTLEEWIDAAVYLTGEKVDFNAVKEVKDYLLHYRSV